MCPQVDLSLWAMPLGGNREEPRAPQPPAVARSDVNVFGTLMTALDVPGGSGAVVSSTADLSLWATPQTTLTTPLPPLVGAPPVVPPQAPWTGFERGQKWKK